jgi:hypothetical protein
VDAKAIRNRNALASLRTAVGPSCQPRDQISVCHPGLDDLALDIQADATHLQQVQQIREAESHDRLNASLHTELWTSWASLLRSYAAAHGLNSPQHAVVEVSADEITFRVGSRWLRFTASAMQQDGQTSTAFRLTEDGNVVVGDGVAEEMDMAAERLAREMME